MTCIQVNEFGQCPMQLFTKPHPPRCASPPWPPAAQQGTFTMLTDNFKAKGPDKYRIEPWWLHYDA